MARLRLTLITRGASPRRRFMVASFLVHVALASAAWWLPTFGRGPQIPPDAMMVELVGPLRPSGAGTVASSPPPAAAVVPEPPQRSEEVEAVVVPPKPVPEKKPDLPPQPKPKPTPPTPEPRAVVPEPPTDRPPTDAPADGSGVAGTAASGETVGSVDDGATVTALLGGNPALGWYRSSVSQALYGSWRRPVLGGIGEPIEVQVDFEIARDGRVHGLTVSRSSGVPTLDRSALRAVLDASPLPALPPNVRESSLSASWVFRLYPDGY